MRLAIFGATGPTGRRLFERAAAEGHEVTAFVRNRSRMRGRHERLSVAVGEVRDEARVEEAVAGREAIICALGGGPSNPLYPRRPGETGEPSSTGARQIVAAMKKHGVRRFVCQSAWGAGESGDTLDASGGVFMKVLVPPFLRDEYPDKDLQEEIIRGSDLVWIIVRPMILTNGSWTGNYRVGEDLRPGRRPFVSRADVAEFLLRHLHDEAFLRRAVAVVR